MCLLCAYIIAFFRCRFGKETSAAQSPPVRNLEALPLMRYNNCWQLFIPLDLSRFSPGLRPKPKNMAYDTAINFRRSMMKNRQRQKDTLFSILIFCSAFAVNLLIQKLFTMQTLVPMIFVFGVFLISLKTHVWHHFGNRQRICGEFCLYLSLLCLRLFRGGKHLICRHYAGSCRFHQYAEQPHSGSGKAAGRK